MAPDSIFIDFSPKADPKFVEAFTYLYRKYLISAKLAYYASKIGIYLSFSLSNLDTVFQASQYFLKNYLQLQYILSIINSCVICVAVLIFGIGDVFAKRRKTEITHLISSYPTYFNKTPFIAIEDDAEAGSKMSESKVQNFSKKIGVGLSCLLSNTSTTLQTGNFNTQLQLIISLINSFVILTAVIIYRTTDCCKATAEKKTEKETVTKTYFFNRSIPKHEYLENKSIPTPIKKNFFGLWQSNA